MSLSFVEDRLSSMSPQGLCLLVGPTQGQKKTTAEKNKCEHKHADHLGTRTEIYCTHKHKHGGHTVWVCFNMKHPCCLFHGVEKMHTSLKIDTCRCPHLEILWDTGGLLFLLSVWWATGHLGPAWSHRHGAPSLEEGGVADGWQARWLWLVEDRGACWWSRLGVRWEPEDGQ